MKRYQILGVTIIITLMMLGGLAFYISSPFPLSLATELTQASSELGYVDFVNITVLIDNYPNGTLYSTWGVSMLVETNNFSILMDAGPSSLLLEENAKALGKNLSLVDFVVISHEHGDHTDGLPCVARINPNITVYVPAHMDNSTRTVIENLGLNVVDISETTILSSGIAIIGELHGPPYEQALGINIEGIGTAVVVGCSHPGVENIVEKAVNDLDVDPYLVIGGFHTYIADQQTINNTVTKLLELGVEKIYPIHCCGDQIRSFIQENYLEHYGEGCVGTQLFIGPRTPYTTPGFSYLSIFIITTVMTISAILWSKKRKERENQY
ncbi:MAG: MBL fold metallo-hydrolase [Candidatus Hermodarchaeota archaeon]